MDHKNNHIDVIYGWCFLVFLGLLGLKNDKDSDGMNFWSGLKKFNTSFIAVRKSWDCLHSNYIIYVI